MNKLYFLRKQSIATQNIVSLNFKRIIYCKLVLTVQLQCCAITAVLCFRCWATPHFFAWGHLTAYILVYVLHSLTQTVSYQRYNSLQSQTRDILYLFLRCLYNSGRQSYKINLVLKQSKFWRQRDGQTYKKIMKYKSFVTTFWYSKHAK